MMQSTVSIGRIARLSIKKRIAFSVALLALIIAMNSLYNYYGNDKIIAHQEYLSRQKQSIEQLEIISNYVAQTELASHSILLLHETEFNQRQKEIWETKISPVASFFRSELKKDPAKPKAKEIKQLLTDLASYQQIQAQTGKKIHSLFPTTQVTDSTGADRNKTKLEMEVIQREAFDAVMEDITLLLQQRHEVMNTENESLLEWAQTSQSVILGLITISLGITFLLGYSLIQDTIVPLQKIRDYISEIALGKQPDPMKPLENEMGTIIGSLNRLVAHLKASAGFASQVGGGKYDNHFIPASADDSLGNALLIMQEKLRNTEEEDKKQNWTTEGIAQFSMLLRDQSNDKNALLNELLRFIVRYLRANQGGLFLLQGESDNHLEMVACYAYDRKKFRTKTIERGEGLVGQSLLEADTIYITQVPPDHLQITSGLGEAPPTSMLIVPLKHNDQVYGVIELASFHTFAPHEIAFMEKLAESAASAISMAQLYEQTRQLLKESRQQAQELKAAEAEMRKNIEEMKASQEEVRLKNESLRDIRMVNLRIVASQLSTHIKSEIDTALDAARTCSQVFATFAQAPELFVEARKQANLMLQNVLKNNPSFLATYTLWEPQEFDGKDLQYTNYPGHDSTGRFIPYWTIQKGDFHLAPLVNYTQDGAGDYFLIPKKNSNEAIIDPYLYPVQGKEIWIISTVAPVLLNGAFKAICGVDFAVDWIQEVIDKVSFKEKEITVAVIAHNKNIVKASGSNVHTGKHCAGFLPRQVIPSEWDKSFETSVEGYTYLFEPIRFGNTSTPWTVCIKMATK